MRTVSRKAYLKNLQLAIKNDQQIARARKGLVAPIPVRKEEDRAITDPVEIRSKARDNLISMFGPTRAEQFLAGLSQNDMTKLNIYWTDLKRALETKTGLTKPFFDRIINRL